ncbi:MAG: tetratricopeptide repeat protein [Planctomycetota bacterium]
MNQRGGCGYAVRTVLQLDPEHVAAKLELGTILVDTHEPQRAAPLLEEVLRQRPDDVEARLQHARALAALGQLDLAARELTQCAAHSRSPLPHYHLAAVLEALGRTGEAKAARAEYQRLLREQAGK